MVRDATASRYALSFTSGTLLTREALIAVPLYKECRDWAQVRLRIQADNLLQARTVRSGFRTAREVAQRLAVLSDAELDLLLEAAPTERRHLMWLAACRHYELIGEFAEEVVRERFLVLAGSVGYEDFDTFVRGKALWHPELDDLKDSTLQKLRSSLFKMLREAGLISQQGQIIPTVLSERFTDLLDRAGRGEVRFFPTTVMTSGGGVQ